MKMMLSLKKEKPSNVVDLEDVLNLVFRALITKSKSIYSYCFQFVTLRKIKFWKSDFFHTIDRIASPTDEMNMLIMMIMF
ncbi:hypothetical protein D3C72_2233360 [compost metagenome]